MASSRGKPARQWLEMTLSDVLSVRAYAKVNLSLEVLGRRDDGFHDIISVVQTISLHDVVQCSLATRMTVDMTPAAVPAEENLATRAAKLLRRETRPRHRARLVIRKRIPVAAGLGGGSSDAAAALRALARLWSTGLERRSLARLAAAVGSDVPLFIIGGTVLACGRGDNVERLGIPRRFWLALACPPARLGDKTATLYGRLREEDWSDGRRAVALAEHLRAGGSPVSRGLANAFDRVACDAYPGFGQLRARLSQAACVPLQLSGSGPSLFALFATRAEAAAAAARMAELGVPCYVARNVSDSHVMSRSTVRRRGSPVVRRPSSVVRRRSSKGRRCTA